MLKEMTGTGTLKGDAISFSLKSTSAMEISFSGKIKGNKMEGTREVKSSGGSRGGAGGQGEAPGGGPGGGQGGAPGGAPGSAPGGGQGGAQAQSSENWTAVRN
jgi:hypothetical protein